MILGTRSRAEGDKRIERSMPSRHLLVRYTEQGGNSLAGILIGDLE